MGLRTGAMDRLITIQQPTEVNTAGNVSTTWSTFIECFADVRPLTASERFASSALHSARVSTFTTHYIEGVSPKMRIIYESLEWKITGIAEIGRREGLQITAEVVY